MVIVMPNSNYFDTINLLHNLKLYHFSTSYGRVNHSIITIETECGSNCRDNLLLLPLPLNSHYFPTGAPSPTTTAQ